jgi:transposase
VAVLGAASSRRGWITAKYKHAKAMKGPDIVEFFKELMAGAPNSGIAIFLDNCKVHTSQLALEFATEVGLPLIFNCSYRPDMNGIELCWAWAKREYRAKLSYYKAMFCSFNNLELVQGIVNATPTKLASKCIGHGMVCLNNAEPIQEIHIPLMKRGFCLDKLRPLALEVESEDEEDEDEPIDNDWATDNCESQSDQGAELEPDE